MKRLFENSDYLFHLEGSIKIKKIKIKVVLTTVVNYKEEFKHQS